MIDGLRAKKLKAAEISKGEYILTKNSPKMIDKGSNKCRGILIEEEQDEKLRILSIFNDDSFALIAHEYTLNFFDQSKAADFFYLYFGEDTKIVSYIYDLKKTLAGIEVIVHLVEQWKMGIATAKACEALLRYKGTGYVLDYENIHIGVITENDDIERRKRDVEDLRKKMVTVSNIAQFVIHMHKANTVSVNSKLKVLEEFEAGYIMFDGKKYDFDIKRFVNQEYTFNFCDGKLL